MTDQQRDAADALRSAWDDLISSLQQARDAIDQPELMPPPASPRNLAEGYRYLMGFVHQAVERAFHEDVERPYFRNALSIITRATIDNADAIYFYAPIDGHQRYLIRGQAGDSRHWRGQAPAPGLRKAPHYLIFETSQGGIAGDSGNLREMQPGAKTQTGRMDSSSIMVQEDGSFEILLGPQRPEDYEGNFISTMKVVDKPHPTNPDIGSERYANYISGRQLFNNWAEEEAIHLEITQLGSEGHSPAPYTPDTAAQELRRCGELVRNQMHFWNAFWTIPMGTYGERPGSIPGVAFPRNDVNRINAASGATGGGMSTNLYAGGVFELEPDEALIIECHIRLPPQYFGFQLGNLWGESLEYASRVTSLNGHQATPDSDGVMRLVIAHSDPGVANWLDTVGHREGFLTARWAYSETPTEEDWPAINARKVRLGEIGAALPEDTPKISTTQRCEQIAIRQQHVQRRYRSF